MSQTAYNSTMSTAFAGMLSDLSDATIDSKRNAESVEMPFGIAVKAGSQDDACLLPAAAGDSAKFAGVTLHTHARDSVGSVAGAMPQIKAAAMCNVLAKGRCYVSVEEAVTPTDPVYVRIGTGVADNTMTQKGSFRKSPDGTAEVHTITPTAANSTIYVLRVKAPSGAVYTFEYVSDADGTATEIVTGFKTAMAADSAFAAELTASGTATLVLTASANGKAFVCHSEGDGALADAVTTPAAPSAVLFKGARWLTSASAAGVAQLELDANVSRLP